MQIQFDLSDPREAMNAIAIVNLAYPSMIDSMVNAAQQQQPASAPAAELALPVVANPGPETTIAQEGRIVGSIGEQAKLPTQEDVNAAIQTYATREGLASTMALLKEFGVNRASELTADQRAAFIGKTQETGK